VPFTHESAAIHGAKGGARGGRSRSKAKQAHARVNGTQGAPHGIKGGRPVELPPEPDGFRDAPPWDPEDSFTQWRHIHYIRRFPEYAVLWLCKKKLPAGPYFTEEEMLETLRRMGRYDLVYRRKKVMAGTTKPRKQPRRLGRAFFQS
jgi:hypothetical protein